jgi:hypothetical protein
MHELKERVAEHYGRGLAQLPLYLPEPKLADADKNFHA